MKKKFNLFVFVFFTFLVFIFFRDLLSSYFSADEWFHFTHYLPLLKDPNAPFVALVKSITDTVALSEGQHVDPISEEIFFLNLKFFGLNFVPYALISIFLHIVNTFLVYLLTQELLNNKRIKSKNTVIAIMAGFFFALTSIPMHAVVWAAFYGQNVLSVTFFLMGVLFLKKAFNNKKKEYLILSSLFFLLDLLTKETAIVLVLILPLMAFLEKNFFPRRLLLKIFSVPLIFFAIFRFILPAIYFFVLKWIDSSLLITGNNALTSQIIQKGTSLSLIIYRTITFPLSMISQTFISSATMFSIMQFITPFIYYQYPEEPAVRGTYRQFFIYGPGNNLFFYLISFGILLLVINLIKEKWKDRKENEAKTILIALLIIAFGALPLVLNVLYLPAWGTDYFDSRHYYMPSVGTAILFPFLIFVIARFLLSLFKSLKLKIQVNVFVLVLFLIWFLNNLNIFKSNMHVMVDVTGIPRRQIISEMKDYLPTLPKKAVIYSETDGLGAYGPVLPFETSFPQILTVVYYPFPDSFYNKFILDAKPEGYFFSDGRGLGVYRTKDSLLKGLLSKQFTINDVYGFYYDSQKVKLKDITKEIRKEMSQKLAELSLK